MNKDELRALILKSLRSVAPELDEATLDPTENFRDQLDIDSMDFLNYVIGLHDALKIDIPEVDYVHLSSIDEGVAYLSKRLT